MAVKIFFSLIFEEESRDSDSRTFQRYQQRSVDFFASSITQRVVRQREKYRAACSARPKGHLLLKIRPVAFDGMRPVMRNVRLVPIGSEGLSSAKLSQG
jgi:hypothetical protein